MLSKLKLNQLYFKDTSFVNLMTKRIFNVLLVANPYDAFMLEDDGRIDEKIFIEYMNLSLRYPPRFTQVSTEEETWKQLKNTTFDLVIVMPGSDNSAHPIINHPGRFEINAGDAEFLQLDGKVRICGCGGDQLGCLDRFTCEYEGTMSELFARFF